MCKYSIFCEINVKMKLFYEMKYKKILDFMVKNICTIITEGKKMDLKELSSRNIFLKVLIPKSTLDNYQNNIVMR